MNRWSPLTRFDTVHQQKQFAIFDQLINHLISLHPKPFDSEFVTVSGRLFENDADRTWHLNIELIMTEGDGVVQVATIYKPLNKTTLLYWLNMKCIGEVHELLNKEIDIAIKECWDRYRKDRCAYY